MHRIPLILAVAAVCTAQTPSDLFTRAPKEVDEALRARMSEFYRNHVEGKYRQAEQLVAEDSRDFFYSSNKPKYLSFEINRIEYSDHFTRAKAIVLCEQHVMMPGFADKALKVPTPSYWKLVDGKWYWYVDEAALGRTPFGEVKPGQAGPGGTPVLPSETEAMGLLTRVKADKSEVEIEEGKTAEVVLTNSAPGPVMLSFLGALPPGVEAVYDQATLKSGDKAVLRIRALEGKPKGKIQVQVSPTNQIIPIEVNAR